MKELCCSAMKEVLMRWGYTFRLPTDLKGIATPAILASAPTPRGNPSAKGRGFVYLRFCPFCGVKLLDKDISQVV